MIRGIKTVFGGIVLSLLLLSACIPDEQKTQKAAKNELFETLSVQEKAIAVGEAAYRSIIAIKNNREAFSTTLEHSGAIWEVYSLTAPLLEPIAEKDREVARVLARLNSETSENFILDLGTSVLNDFLRIPQKLVAHYPEDRIIATEAATSALETIPRVGFGFFVLDPERRSNMLKRWSLEKARGFLAFLNHIHPEGFPELEKRRAFNFSVISEISTKKIDFFHIFAGYHDRYDSLRGLPLSEEQRLCARLEELGDLLFFLHDKDVRNIFRLSSLQDLFSETAIAGEYKKFQQLLKQPVKNENGAAMRLHALTRFAEAMGGKANPFIRQTDMQAYAYRETKRIASLYPRSDRVIAAYLHSSKMQTGTWLREYGSLDRASFNQATTIIADIKALKITTSQLDMWRKTIVRELEDKLIPARLYIKETALAEKLYSDISKDEPDRLSRIAEEMAYIFQVQGNQQKSNQYYYDFVVYGVLGERKPVIMVDAINHLLNANIIYGNASEKENMLRSIDIFADLAPDEPDIATIRTFHMNRK